MLENLQQLRLNQALPFAAAVFALACLASMGMPGFSGFVAELSVLIGAWHAFPTLAVLGGAGVLLGVAYTLRVLQKSFFGDSRETMPPPPLEPISIPERLGAVILLFAILVVGLFPRLLLDLIVPALTGPVFDGLWKAGGS